MAKKTKKDAPPDAGSERVVAFLRGMNLGKRRITNDDLARHFTEAGLKQATPYQASGNVVFEHPGGPVPTIESRLAAYLADALGYEVDTFVRTLDELRTITDREGLAAAEEEGFKVHVIFLHEPPDPAVAEQLGALETDDDRFLFPSSEPGSRQIYWLRRGRLSDSTIDASNPGSLTGGRTSTMRTLGTLRRIVKKFG